MSELPSDLAEPLSRQWRYTELLAELHRSGEEGDSARLAVGPGEADGRSDHRPETVLAAAEAWLLDVAHPPRDLSQAMSRLLAGHRFELAERLAADTELLRAEEVNADRLAREVADAKVTHQQEQRRDEHMLVARARAAGVSVPTSSDSSLPGEVKKAEEKRALGLIARLEAASLDDPEFGQRVRDCVAAGEYATAEQLLDTGPGEEVIGGPESVRRPVPWHYRDSIGEMLNWYDGGESARDFDLRKPAPDDDCGLALVTALRAIWADLTPETARALGDAVDGLIGDVQVGHPPVPLPGGGYVVQLRGLSDQRFQWLGLPPKVDLAIGAAPAAQIGGIALWLPLTEKPEAPPDGVAVITARDLLELSAPRAGRIPPRPSFRRINLLRVICRQLPPEQVIRADPGDLGSETETREAIGWMFDLMGLRSMAVVKDALVYDTSGMPTVICELARLLGTRVHRPGDLDHQVLREIRTDWEAIARIRSRVTANLEGDLNALVVLGALLLGHSDAGSEPISLLTLKTDLTVLAELAALEAGDSAPADRGQSLIGHIDIDGGVHQLAAAGLVVQHEPDGDREPLVRFRGPGLAALLADNGLLTETVDNVWVLQQNWHEERRAARIALGQRTGHAYRHLRRNYDFALQQLMVESRRGDLDPEQRAKLNARVDRVQGRIRTLNLIEQDRLEELRARNFDIHDLLSEVRRVHDYPEATVVIEISVTEGTPAVLPVRGIQELVHLAIDDLVVNADQAMARADSPARRLRIGVRCADREIERIVVLDLEDSGPGFGMQPRTDSKRQQAGLAGGEGLANVRQNLASCRGQLEILSEPSTFGGAHVRIVLPLSDRPPAAVS